MGALTVEINCLKEKLEEEKKLRLVQDQNQVIILKYLLATHTNSSLKTVMMATRKNETVTVYILYFLIS